MRSVNIKYNFNQIVYFISRASDYTNISSIGMTEEHYCICSAEVKDIVLEKDYTPSYYIHEGDAEREDNIFATKEEAINHLNTLL